VSQKRDKSDGEETDYRLPLPGTEFRAPSRYLVTSLTDIPRVVSTVNDTKRKSCATEEMSPKWNLKLDVAIRLRSFNFVSVCRENLKFNSDMSRQNRARILTVLNNNQTVPEINQGKFIELSL
jgi:hypothetical protein